MIKHRLFTSLNVFGLAIGMTCSLLIFLWVQDEKSFDRFNANADKMYRIVTRVSEVDAATVPPALARAVQTEIPAVKRSTLIAALQKMVTVGSQKFDEKNIFLADSNFLRMFDYPLLEGNAANVLSIPNAAVLTEATAIKYFGTADNVVGKRIFIDNNIKGTSLQVTGVLKNIPGNSHLQFDMLVSIGQYEYANNWDNFDGYVYIQLADHVKAGAASLAQIEKQVNDIRKKNDTQNLQATLSLQALTDIHLHSHLMLDVGGQGNSQYVTIFSLIALFILLIACINFMNLSTALSAQRAKEIGLRKTIGAQRVQLVIQFMTEALLVSLAALVMAVALAILLMPLFNELSSKSISIDLLNFRMIATLLGTAILTGLVSGSYPAVFLSSFHPIQVLKGLKIMPGRSSLFRSGLVVLQFSISVILMISTLVVYNQLQFIHNRDIGFNKENLLYIKMPEVGDLYNNKNALKAMLSQDPAISDYTITDNLPTYLTSGMTFTWPTMPAGEQAMGFRLRTDEHFVKTFGMHLLSGRFFSDSFKGDDSSYVVNEATLKVMKLPLAEALGKKINFNDRVGTIIGVVKDFNFQPVQQAVEPLIIRNNFGGGYVVVRTTPANIQRIVASIKKIYGNVYNDYPFSYGFVNEDLSRLYVSEQQMGKLFNVFSVLSIIISCLGLFGLATFATQKRVREIGVRKVLGASEAGIVALLSKDFIRLVALALLIAFPIAWWAMNQWLQGYVYRISISWWIFAAAGATAIFIAFLTVSYQSVRAALANPVKSLRTE